MSKLIGFWLIMEAVIIICSCDLEWKSQVKVIVLMSVFVTMIMSGAYLIAR